MNDLLIREAVTGDLDAITAFNVRLAWESESIHLDAGVVRRGVARALAHPALCRYYVAEMNGQAVGQTMVTYEVSDWRDGLHHWIQSVYVDPARRNAGIFRALYEHVVATARRSGDARTVKLYVDKDNGEALAVYEKLGMRRSHYHMYEVEVEDGTGA